VTSNKKYLDPVLLSKLGNMDLISRCVVEGMFTGVHPSPFHGFSVEYSDHRDYQPGDELKFLDWKVYGRSDKLYIKRFEQDTNVFVYIVLDSSHSMGFSGEGSVCKLDYGSYLAAALTYLMLGQGDSVGLVCFAEEMLAHIPPRSRRTHLNTILTELGKNKPQGQTHLGQMLHRVAELTHRRGIVIVISDLLDDQEEVFKGLAHLKYLKHDLIILHTLDHQELNLNYEGLVEFSDMESDRRIKAFPQSLRDAYQQRVHEFIEKYSDMAGKNGMDYCLLDTSEPLDKALLAYLNKRKQLM
jgi:uncharacterized protein (DUF58 family)